MIIVHHPSEGERYIAALRQALPGQPVIAADKAPDGSDAYFVCWQPPAGFFARFAAPRAVFVLGAGVNHLLERDDLPDDVPLVRLTDAGMAAQMLEYARYGVLTWQRDFDRYRAQQAERRWQVLPAVARSEVRVGVLGLGEMGGHVAAHLAADGYRVSGFSRTARDIRGVRCLSGPGALQALLEGSDVVVNLLPATTDTRQLLNARTLAHLPQGAALVHAGRGSQLDEDALLAALESGQLRFALLDVFADEPLPAGHPLWTHPGVTITPHVAAQTLPADAAAQIAGKLLQLEQGEPVAGLVERARGY
ncbi:2-hydroxyacid dehydrogenase [Crenobacter caeni]|uniref:Glyoxylate/hydroxypyruvate reductase A n=1 Tax=Crenobacter caeni TaxID=2705474 RepID=A0A6B2KRJ1_9NEIS|nr:glyoxylate/hydroxypyruvate reductase A [Crenobacter caeni]NDV12754.1 glyoxylate/hydroxypyruvate reductase A [Crenobacter caeni]